jgi:hypothetical protein
MKKLLIGIMILALVVFASSAMAQAVKVPKNLCLDYVSFPDYHQLIIKSLGNVATASGNVKMYTIHGYAQGLADHPVHGSGYVIPGTTIFHATYNGQGYYDSLTSNTLRSWELTFDLATNSGTNKSRFDHDNDTIFSDPTGASVVGADCSSMGTPTAIRKSGNLKAMGE